MEQTIALTAEYWDVDVKNASTDTPGSNLNLEP